MRSERNFIIKKKRKIELGNKCIEGDNKFIASQIETQNSTKGLNCRIIALKSPNDLEPLHMNLTFQSQSTALIKNSQGKAFKSPPSPLLCTSFLMYMRRDFFVYLEEIKIMSSISLHVSALWVKATAWYRDVPHKFHRRREKWWSRVSDVVPSATHTHTHFKMLHGKNSSDFFIQFLWV